MTVKDMKDRFPTDTIDHISNDAVKASATSVVPADTLIVATRISLGRIARPRFETAINQDLKALFLAEGIDKTFVEHWWRWRSGHIQSLGTGTTVKGIRLEDVRSLKIDVPPAGEQKRLADKLDAILTRVDACRERLDNVPVILKRFRQALLAAATSGKLTEEWRAEQGKSEEWPTVRLTDVGEIGRGKSKHRPRNDPRLYGGPYPFIQTGDVAQSGGRITTHSQTYSEFGIAQSKLWPAGTVCITIAANIADTAILEYPACFPDSVVGFVADPTKSLPEFIKWSIDVISERLEAFAPATAQKNINLAVLNDVEFRCPPLDEQHEIVRRVEALFAYADRLEARYTTASDHIDRLTPALLAKAFRGELVPQDPNDEPASALLERIRAARAAAEEVATPKQRKGSRHKTSRKTEVLMLTRRDIQNAHLTTILKERGPLTAEALWSASQLDIDDFYDQLKDEEARGFLREKRGDSSNALRMVEAA
jgi:type I restriction enzyme S subunit